MALPDIKDVGIVADFVRWGYPWHGLCRGGSVVLPDASTRSVAQPSGGDVLALRVPGTAAIDLTPAEIVAEAAQGREWYDYTVMSGAAHSFYETPIGSNSWIWAKSATEKWRVVLSVATIGTVAGPSTTVTINATLTEACKFTTTGAAPVTHSLSMAVTPSGTWSCGEDVLPVLNQLAIIDVSSDGSKVILAAQVSDYSTFNHKKRVRGFLLLEMTSTTTATLTTLADLPACNPGRYTIVWTDYGVYGMQPDGHYLDPYPVWAWFSSSDAVELVSMYYTVVQLYPGVNPPGGTLEIGLKVDGVTRTRFYVSSSNAAGTGATDFDGFGSAKLSQVSIDAWIAGGGDPTVLNKVISARVLATFAYDYYVGEPVYAGESPDGGQLVIEPIIYSNKAVGLVLKAYHAILGASPPSYYELPDFIVSDHYYGSVAHPGGAASGVVHAPVEPTNFTAAISGSTMSVSAMAQGSISVGAAVAGAGVAAGTTVTALGTGSGGVGTYTVSPSQTVGSVSMTGVYQDRPYTSYQPVTGDITRNDANPVCYV